MAAASGGRLAPARMQRDAARRRAASARAIAAPSPREAPVTSATRPVRSNGFTHGRNYASCPGSTGPLLRAER